MMLLPANTRATSISKNCDVNSLLFDVLKKLLPSQIQNPWDRWVKDFGTKSFGYPQKLFGVGMAG